MVEESDPLHAEQVSPMWRDFSITSADFRSQRAVLVDPLHCMQGVYFSNNFSS